MEKREWVIFVSDDENDEWLLHVVVEDLKLPAENQRKGMESEAQNCVKHLGKNGRTGTASDCARVRRMAAKR